MGLAATSTSSTRPPGPLAGANGAHVSDQLLEKARADGDTVLRELSSRLDGLSEAEAALRLKQYGLNEIAREKRQSALMRLLSNVKNPLVILLTALGVLSFLTGDLRATAVIFVMVLLGVVLRFFQEMRADQRRREAPGDGQQHGDGGARRQGSRGAAQDAGAGRHHPAGRRRHGPGRRAGAVRQGPVPESGGSDRRSPCPWRGEPTSRPPTFENPLDLPNICFLGSNVESGSATAVVIHHRRQDLLWIAGCQYRRASAS